MRIFTRYILREVISHALLGGVLFTLVLFVGRLGKIVDLVVRESASFRDVTRIVAYLLPDALNVTIPMAVLVGILLGLSRLAADSEITAMRASGMSALDFVRVVSIVSVAALGVGLVNSLYLAPKSATALLALENELKTSQASFEVQPRVFYEDFKNIVLYVQDVRPAAGASLWRHVFVADLTRPASPNVTTADSAVVVNGGSGDGGPSIRMHLQNGGEHEVSATNPDQYNITTFDTYDLPLQAGAVDETHVSRMDAPLQSLPLRELFRKAYGNGLFARATANTRLFRIEMNRRLSFPCACLVLMLVGVPLGLSSKRGGKSMGFVLTIVLVLIYYFLSSVGVALARQQKLPPVLGVWGANILFAVVGLVLLQQMSYGGIAINALAGFGVKAAGWLPRWAGDGGGQRDTLEGRVVNALRRLRGALHIRFPLLLDEYVMREYAKNFLLVLLTFSSVTIVFTFFDLVGDIVRNKTAVVTVGDYLLNLLPFILDRVVPLCSLVAALLTFGTLSRTSELTAMKATGISIYRIIAPVLVLTAVIAAGLFAFDELYLPGANRRQEALRSVIKGKPAQTFLRPERKWISGMTVAENPGVAGTETAGMPAAKQEPARIFYYQFFDADKNVFANLTVFEFDPATFSLQRRIFAASARWDQRVSRWVFDNGWQRTFAGETVANYQPFTISVFPEIREQPSYFKKEDLQSQEMSYGELERYISDLKQSGFDTLRLRVQLNHKLAYPLVTLVMAALAIPFALTMGKRGGLAGVATAIGIGICYWVVASAFEAMGNVNTLPPLLAAWTPDVLFGLAGAYLLLRTPT